MKGIAGIVYPDVFQMSNLVRPMLAILKHRNGSLGTDVYTHKNVEIGLVGGKFAANDKYTILGAIDGHITNHEDLRQEFANEGNPSKDITELLIRGYEKWDTGLFDRVRGEFLILILDQRKKRLLLCRDRIGKKPLYWFQNQNYFIFGSELKALMVTGIIPQTPALDSLSSYLYFGYIPQDMSPIQGVSKLLPAHYLQLNFDGTKTIHTYWSYSSYFEKQNKNSLQANIKELDHLLEENIKFTQPKPEKVGCFISGGLGCACVSRYLTDFFPKENIVSYTSKFQGEDEANATICRNLVEHLGIQNKDILLSPKKSLQDLIKIAWYIDEPLADPNVLSYWNLAALASKETPLVFSGMGADELFAAHSRYSIEQQRNHTLRRNLQGFINASRKVLIPFFKLFYKPLAYQLIKQSRTNPLQFEYLQQNALMDEHEMRKASPRLGGIFDPEVFLHKFHHLNRVKSNVASYLYFDVKTLLPDKYIIQLDRITAAHSIIWRLPFIDRIVVEFVATLPEPQFLRESETGSYLRAMMRDKLPKAIVDRSKKTRKDFLRSWIDNEEIKKIFTILLEGTLVESGLISKSWIQKKILHLEEDPNAFMHLWAILMLSIWFGLYINKPLQLYPPDVSLEEFLTQGG